MSNEHTTSGNTERVNRSRLVVIAPLIAMLALGATSCGDDDSSAATTPPASIADGTVYRSTAAKGMDLPSGVVVTLGVQGSTLGVSGGCNTMSGGFSVDGDTLVVGALVQTQMACEQSLMDFDAAIASFLTSGPTIAISGEKMTLTGGDVVVDFEQVAAVRLEGTTWTVASTVENEAATGLTTDPATITFADGTAQVFTGCNSGSAGYTITGDTIAFEPLALTKMACPGPATALEAAVTTVLTGSVTYAITGTTLTLTNGTTGLVLRPA